MNGCIISDYVIWNYISNNVISNQSWLAWLDVINFELFGITAIDQSNTQWSNVLLHQRVVNFCIPLFYKKFDGFYWGTSCCKHFFAVVLHNWCVIFTFVKVFYTNVKVIFTNETVIFTDVKKFYGASFGTEEVFFICRVNFYSNTSILCTVYVGHHL